MVVSLIGGWNAYVLRLLHIVAESNGGGSRAYPLGLFYLPFLDFGR